MPKKAHILAFLSNLHVFVYLSNILWWIYRIYCRFSEVFCLFVFKTPVHTRHGHRYTLSNTQFNIKKYSGSWYILISWISKSLDLQQAAFAVVRSAAWRLGVRGAFERIWTHGSLGSITLCSAASSHHGVRDSPEWKVFYQEADKERANVASAHSYLNLWCNIETR